MELELSGVDLKLSGVGVSATLRNGPLLDADASRGLELSGVGVEWSWS